MAIKYTPPRLKEKPKQSAYRLYGIDKKSIRMIARHFKPKLSDSEAVRRAIRSLRNALYPETQVQEHTGK